MLLLAACAPPQRPLAADERPNVVIVATRGAMGDPPRGAAVLPLAAAAQDPARAHAALLATPDGDALPRVLALYGYATASTTAADVASFGFAEQAGPGWLTTAPEPFLLADSTLDLAPLRARGLLDRTVVVVVGEDGWDTPSALWWIGPGAPPPLRGDRLASVTDVLPTVLARARATVPASAEGVDLAYGAASAAIGEAADGTFVARTASRRAACPSADPLCDAVRARLERRAARAARDDGALRALEVEQGYWR